MTFPPLILRAWLPWLLFALTESLAQVSLKWAGEVSFATAGFLPSYLELFHQKWFAVSIGCDILSFLSWICILSRHDLSFAVPVSALTYFAVVAAGTVLLHEVPDGWQLVSLLLIGAGLLTIAHEEFRKP